MMNPRIDIIGIGADGPAGLRPELLQRIRAAEFLAGGQRHLEHFPDAGGERFVIRDNLALLVEELAQRRARQRCVVLASGDPLCFGIGSYLLPRLGPEQVRIEPAISSMQLAFARAGLPWHDATLASIHGRDVRCTLLPLLGRPKIGLFTQDGHGPGQVAAFFTRFGLAEQYQAIVGERLGAAEERISRWDELGALRDQHFADLNFLILHRQPWPGAAESARLRALVPGVPDEAFAQPVEEPVMTRQEVRSVLLGKLGGLLQPGDTVWDLGAGLGTVAIEMAVLRPDVEVIAVESKPARAEYLRQNRERFDARNIRILVGTAPQTLAQEPDRPRLVFLGGSGHSLLPILADVEQRLRAGGRLLANFVTLENLMTTYQRFRGKGWKCDITELHVAHSDGLGDHTGLKPHRAVFLLVADKPGVRR